MRPFVLCAIAVMLCGRTAGADQEGGQREYSKLTEDRRYLFVMRNPGKWSQYLQYPASGLYRVGKPGKPLWTVAWYAPEVYVSSDGLHAVRVGPWARQGDGFQTLALAFYRSGHQLRRYMVRYLLKYGLRPAYSVSHYRWYLAMRLDDRTGRLTVVAPGDGELRDPARTLRYLFDIRTGRLISVSHASPTRKR